jgi:ABC-type sugar transport system substrate-binding protein
MRGSGLRLTLVAALVAVAALAVVACGDDDDGGSGSSGSGGDGGGERLKIGEVFYSTDPYQVALEKWMKRYADDEDFDFTSCNQDLKPEPGIDCVRNWVTQDYDGIIYAPVDPAAAVAPTKQAQAAKIPVIAVATKPGPGVELPFADAMEKEQTTEAGKRAAEQAKELFPGEPVSALVLDLPNLPICKERRMGGFIEGLKSVDPDATVIAVDGKGDRAGARAVAADAIQSGKKFNIVTACTGEMIQGALSALKSAGRGKAAGKKPESEYVFAIDGDRLQVQQLLDPSSPVMQVMGLTPKENGRKAVDLLMQAIDKKIEIDSAEVAPLPARLLEPDCEAANEYLQEEYFDEPVDCP